MKQILIALCSLFLFSCYSNKAVTRKIDRLNFKNAPAVAKAYLKLYPIRLDTPKVTVDTVTVESPVNLDSLKAELEKERPKDTVREFLPDSTCVVRAEGLKSYIAKQDKLIDRLIKESKENVKTITITKEIPWEDTHKTVIAQNKVDSISAVNIKQQEANQKLEKRIKRTSTVMWSFIVVFLLSVMVNIVQFKLKI